VHEAQPSWQIDACPAWCSGGHHEGDHPDDRVHRSLAVAVPVVVRHTRFEGSGIRRSSDAAEFEVALSRVDGEAATWVYLGDGPTRSLEFSAESAARVLHELGLALDGAARSR